ncbi:MAG TPA: ferritin-like domain-containing protein [Verrucomicrobiae bacterium]|jgi:ferritin-like metal-binding protein YciE|nr:ferritin-like domain-containing protein [Verrucomicrobiae bacterium]
MEHIKSLEGLLLHEIQDLYSAEKQLVKALPKVAEKASSPQLKSAVEQHLQQTEEHVNRLERVFDMLGAPAKTTTCKAMKGLINEAEELLKIKGPDETRDAAIVLAAQKVEHYEIASYGSATKWAAIMGRNDVKAVLGQTLNEEEQTDQKLTQLATSGINQRAADYREQQLAE